MVMVWLHCPKDQPIEDYLAFRRRCLEAKILSLLPASRDSTYHIGIAKFLDTERDNSEDFVYVNANDFPDGCDGIKDAQEYLATYQSSLLGRAAKHINAKEYSAMDQKYEDLRFLSRQYGQRISDVSRLKTQLLDHLDQTMPGITGLLSLKSRTPEKCTLLPFIKRFKSFDEVRRIGKTRFLSAYTTLVKKTSDRYAAAKALAIYELALNSITIRGDDPYIWSVQTQCVDLLAAAQNAADAIILQMQNIAETIHEYKVLRAMRGVGDRLGPIILAEIGDVRRFHSAKALNSYAGNDAPPYQSGQFESRNRHISKRGSPALRKACFEVMQVLKLTKPQDDPVYLFMLKKEQEGKPHNVAKMAGVNKFLRIFYARAMELYR